MRLLLVDFSPFGEALSPISLGHLAAMAKQKGHEPRILSLGNTTRFSPTRLRDFILDEHPHLIGFAVYQRNLPHVWGLTRFFKSVLPEVRVIWGGPQITFMPPHALDELGGVDFLARDEGESVIISVLDAMKTDAIHEPIAGVVSRAGDGSIVQGPRCEPITHLDDIPSPWLEGALDPADWDECIMLTSRGCPFDCAFCYTPRAFGRKTRVHSVERVLEEIAWVAKKGTGRLWFADPNFSFRKSRVLALLEGIAAKNLDVSLWLETRADMVNDEMLALMKRAGVRQIAMGLESASPQVTPYLEKRLNLDSLRRAIAAAFARGLDVELFSQYGLPGETRADALATLAFVKDCGVRIRGNSNAQQMQLYFGTRFSDNPVAFGIIPQRLTLPTYLSLGTEYETRWMNAGDLRAVKNAWQDASEDGGKRVIS